MQLADSTFFYGRHEINAFFLPKNVRYTLTSNHIVGVVILLVSNTQDVRKIADIKSIPLHWVSQDKPHP